MKSFLFFILMVCLSNVYAQEAKYYGGEPAKKLDWTLFYLKSHYVDSIDSEQLVELAIKRMLAELDPFSYYQSKAALDAQQKRDEGIKNDGLGFRYYIIRDTVTVTYLEETGPAKSGGLKRGDKLLSMDNNSLVGKNYALLDEKLEADKGTKVQFEILRQGNNQQLSIQSERLFEASVDAAYMLEKDIGYIKINRFTVKTVAEFQKAIKNLKTQGAAHLVLDLRGNLGGVVKGAIGLADEFLSADKLIMHADGNGFPKETYLATGEGNFEKGKVVILVNPKTASASEIFTAAMQEWDRALIIGELTYGKGLIQQSYLLNDSAAVRLTIGRYFTPTGRMLQRPYQFDSTKDWVFQNIANAVYQDDFTIALDAPASNIFETKSGRKVLKGQGGIIPDIYLSERVTETPLLNQLNRLGLVYRFAVYHADKNRIVYQNKYPSGNAFRLDKQLDKKIETAYLSFLQDRLNDKEFLQSILNKPLPQTVINQIKAWIGPQIWESGSYYAVFNEVDPIVIRAIKAISNNSFEQIGIGN